MYTLEVQLEIKTFTTFKEWTVPVSLTTCSDYYKFMVNVYVCSIIMHLLKCFKRSAPYQAKKSGTEWGLTLVIQQVRGWSVRNHSSSLSLGSMFKEDDSYW